jgi:hypothetical protein
MAYFDRVFPMMGWDKVPTPKWQMVPVGSPPRYLYLRDGKDLIVSSTVPILAITEVNDAALPAWYGKRPKEAGDRIFKLAGAAKGTTMLQARSASGIVMAEVEIAVKLKILKTAAFHFVKDSATPEHKTSKNPSEASGWCDTINYIYQQCNVEIRCESAKSLTVTEDLGDCVGFASRAPSDWHTLKALRDTTVDFNIFQVWEYEKTDSIARDTANGGSRRAYGMSVVEDNASDVHAHTVAHEIGHLLGLPDISDSGRKHHLMYGSGRTGQNLSKSEVNLMNR